MPFCRNCGNKLPDSAKFCNKCGTPVPPKTIPIQEKDGKFVADMSEFGDDYTVTVVDVKEQVVEASAQVGEVEIGGWGGDFVEDDVPKKSGRRK